MARAFPAKRRKIWLFMPSFVQAMGANNTFASAGVAFTNADTILRMLGEYVICPESAPAATDAVKIGVGLIKVTSDAFAVGATALPEPSGDPQSPWLFWAEHSFFYSSTDPEAGGSAAGVVRSKFDIKTMRKFAPNEHMVWVTQYANITGNPPMTILVSQVRTLIAVA